MDLDALREDLQYWDDWTGDDWPLGNLSNVLAAARAVLDSEEKDWCASHDLQAVDGECEAWVSGASRNRCRPEPVLVVRVRLLAEEGT